MRMIFEIHFYDFDYIWVKRSTPLQMITILIDWMNNFANLFSLLRSWAAINWCTHTHTYRCCDGFVFSISCLFVEKERKNEPPNECESLRLGKMRKIKLKINWIDSMKNPMAKRKLCISRCCSNADAAECQWPLWRAVYDFTQRCVFFVFSFYLS